jgi:hypothetical protein
MHARQLIDEASFGPEALPVIRQAFDAAWEEISATLAPILTTHMPPASSLPLRCSQSPAKTAAMWTC